MKSLDRRVMLDLSKISSNSSIQPMRKPRRESPRSVQQVIPPCAIQCVRNFISTNFPMSVCPNPEDLPCLCTKRSTNGLTIGEGAVQCLLSTCSEILDFEAYGICFGIENALPNTQSALTVTVIATPSALKSSDATSSPIHTFFHRIASVIPTPAISMARNLNTRSLTTVLPSTRQESSVSSTPGPAATVSITPVPTSTTNEMATAERSRIIGLSVGAAVVGFVLVGILMFLCARKRRSKIRQKEENDSFEIGGEMFEPQLPVTPLTGSQLSPVPRTPIGSYNRPIVESLSPLPKAHVSPAWNQPSTWESRLFVVDDNSSTRTPRRLASQASASRLLPEQLSQNDCIPMKTPVGLGLPKGTKSGQFTEYHELPSNSPGYSPVNCYMPLQHTHVGTAQQFPDPGTSYTYLDSAGEGSRGYEKHLSPCRTPIYNETSTPPRKHSPTTKLADCSLFPKSHSGHGWGSESNTKFNRYTRTWTADRGQNTSDTVTRHVQSPNYRDSVASMTSFETADSDYDGHRDNAPVNLSPVKEYPSPELRATGSFGTNRTGHQPSSSPRPLPKSCPLEPRSQSGASTGSLLAKRRGESFAGKLENGLTVPSSRPHRTRDLKRGLPSNPRSATRPPRLWERQITQPAERLWSIAEPSPGPRKLTPTRDGDNLVLRFD